ncbi:type II toxin-antitoxin system RelE/ParE family toxin [Pasteurella testudinis]
MIKSFKHKGLKQFFERGTTKGIRADHAKKIRFILATIHVASSIEQLADIYQFHELKGDR